MVRQRLVELLEIRVVDVLEGQRRSPRDGILDDIQQSDDVGAAAEILQDFDLAPDLLLFHRLEDLDDRLLVVRDVDGVEHLAVLAPTQLPHDLVGWRGKRSRRKCFSQNLIQFLFSVSGALKPLLPRSGIGITEDNGIEHG